MAQWEFYGRQKEGQDLARRLQIHPDQPYRRQEPARFVAVGIGGRRGVGKNTLLNHVVTQHGWRDRLLVVRLPAEVGNARKPAVFLTTMQTALRRAGMTPLLDDLPDMDLPEEWHLAYIIEHLVHKDIIVCLDEVHAIIGTILPTILQGLIDDLRDCSVPAAARAPGKLVLMGSHQQQFSQLQHDRAPLHQRFRTLQLRPWSSATVMDIARAHGWDRRPARFQALWTAYDGMPREWERFAQGDDTPPGLSQNWDIPSGDEARDRAQDELWYRDFVRHERDLLERDSRPRWDSKAYVELPPALRDAIIWMGAQRDPRTLVAAQKIVQGVTNAARHASITLDPPMPAADDLSTDLRRLAQDTQIVQERIRFIGNAKGGPQRWRLNDNTTLFQLALAPDIFTPRYRRKPPGPLRLPDMTRALQTLEGTALEHLTANWLQGHPHEPGEAVCAGAKAPAPKGRPLGDIDVLARLAHGADLAHGPQDLLILVNAKRNSREHEIGHFEQVIQHFMAQGTTRENDSDEATRQEIREIRYLPRTLLFVSPAFAPDDRARIQAAGHLPLDLNDMAAEMRAGWPLLQERLDRARKAAPGQEIRIVLPPRPRATSVASPPEPKAATDRSKTKLEKQKTPAQADTSKDEVKIETDRPKP